MTICERIFVEIQQKKLSQKQFAVNIGSTEKTVSAWKKRNSDPPAHLIPAIADELNVSMDYLLTGKEKSSLDELSPNERELLSKFKLLTETEQGKILGRIDGFIEERRANNNSVTLSKDILDITSATSRAAEALAKPTNTD